MNRLIKKTALIFVSCLAVCLSAAPEAHASVLEDGEGASAVLAAKYSLSNAAIRVAQMTTEEPSVPILAGSGAAKYVFEVGTGPFVSIFRNDFATSQDFSSLATDEVSYDFYWNGFDNSLSGRAAGTTQSGIGFSVIGGTSGNRVTSLNINLFNEMSISGTGLVVGWNTIVLDLPEAPAFPRFRDNGTTTINTINGVAIDTSSMTASVSSLSSLADHNDLWANVDAFQFTVSHAGQGGNPSASEGFFGVDNASLGPIPEPASLSLLVAGGALMLRRK